MKTRFESLLPLTMAVLLVACADEDSGRSGFLVSVVNHSPSAPAPSHMTVTWFSNVGILFENQRVPEKGKLEPEGAALATIVIDTDLGVMGTRRILIRSFNDKGEMLAEAAERDLMVPLGPVRKQLNIKLVAGALDDGDMDNVPDLADNCPGAANKQQTLPCPAGPDAGADTIQPTPRFDTNDMMVDMRVDPPMDTMPDLRPVNTDLPAGNIIVNPGFEDGTTGWEMVLGAATAKGPGKSGSNAMYITGGDGYWRQRVAAFYDNATYRLSAWGKGTTNASKCRIGYQYKRSDNSNPNEFALLSSANFVRTEIMFTVPKGATNLSVILQNFDEPECAYDDIELTVMR
ncbi:MAG: carbohydrate binding domain-containing protein [Deltaproteobacteria bacterium]|nr:carbohydrate binding domain-containing protein [Deltaproteobacteria bacterium]